MSPSIEQLNVANMTLFTLSELYEAIANVFLGEQL